MKNIVWLQSLDRVSTTYEVLASTHGNASNATVTLNDPIRHEEFFYQSAAFFSTIAKG